MNLYVIIIAATLAVLSLASILATVLLVAEAFDEAGDVYGEDR